MDETLRYFEALVQGTPAVDVHTHQGDRGVWQAPNLFELLAEDELRSDLLSAGCPLAVFEDPELQPEDRVRQIAPYAKLVRNTVNYWCFDRIIRDLYAFEDEYLDETNCESLFAAVADKAQDAQWELGVLDKGGLAQAAAPFHFIPRLPERYFAYENGDYMFCLGLRETAQQCLTKLSGQPITTAAALAEAIDSNLHFLAEAERIRALRIWLPQTWVYQVTEEGRAETLLHRSLASTHLEPEEQNQLVSFAADRVAESCGQVGIVLQLLCGVGQPEKDGPRLSVYRPSWLHALGPYFQRHPQTKFDLFLGSRALSHEAAVMACHYPNLWVSGAWRHAFTPRTMSEFFRDRLEMLPMSKWNAFFSDATDVEWMYGKLALTRNRLARALAEMVDEGLLTRTVAAEMARRVLYDNPRQLYLGIEPETCVST